MLSKWRSLLQNTRVASTSRKAWVVSALVIGLVSIGLIGYLSLRSTQPASESNSACPKQPNFATILPADKSINQLGGWKPLCPPGSPPTYAYSDQIDSATITVTQSPVPEAFNHNPQAALKKLAEAEHYPKELVASDNTVFYLGISAKGPQSIATIKNDLLVLIKSDQPVEDASWINYIGNLN